MVPRRGARDGRDARAWYAGEVTSMSRRAADARARAREREKERRWRSSRETLNCASREACTMFSLWIFLWYASMGRREWKSNVFTSPS